jgi:hypothetical protein
MNACFDDFDRWTIRPRAACAAVLTASLALATGCGNFSARSPDGGGDGGGTPAYCATPDPGTLDYIDDMEDGNPNILGRDGRVSQWYTYNDGTVGVQQPVPNVAPPMESIPGSRCSFSTEAMRVTGSGFTNWGSGFGFDFKTAFGDNGYAASTYDGTAYRGITFWARVGDPSIATIWFGVGDQWSIPSGGNCDETITNGPTACYDVFGTTVELTTEWKRYAFQWGQLGQRAFGLPRPELDVAHLFNAHFDVAPSPVFDVWIDDIAFYK